MPKYYLDKDCREGEPFLVHRHFCLFRSKDAVLLGDFLWKSRVMKAAKAYERKVGWCPLCGRGPPLKRKKRQSKLQRLAEKLRRAHGQRY